MHRPFVPSYRINTYYTKGPFSLCSGLHYNDHAMSVCRASVIRFLCLFFSWNQDNGINAKDRISLDEESRCYADSGVGFTHEFMLLNVLSRR